jgi:hypothetical protein
VSKRPWIADDIAKLKSMARRVSTVEIAKELGRGVSATDEGTRSRFIIEAEAQTGKRAT